MTWHPIRLSTSKAEPLFGSLCVWMLCSWHVWVATAATLTWVSALLRTVAWSGARPGSDPLASVLVALVGSATLVWIDLCSRRRVPCHTWNPWRRRQTDYISSTVTWSRRRRRRRLHSTRRSFSRSWVGSILDGKRRPHTTMIACKRHTATSCIAWPPLGGGRPANTDATPPTFCVACNQTFIMVT